MILRVSIRLIRLGIRIEWFPVVMRFALGSVAVRCWARRRDPAMLVVMSIGVRGTRVGLRGYSVMLIVLRVWLVRLMTLRWCARRVVFRSSGLLLFRVLRRICMRRRRFRVI